MPAAVDGPRPRGLLRRVNGVAVLLAVVDVGRPGRDGVVHGSGGRVDPGRSRARCWACGRAGRIYRRRLWLSWLQDLPRSLATAAIAFALLSGVTALVSGRRRPTLGQLQLGVIAFTAGR